MNRFRKLSVTSTIAAIVLVGIGGLVRATKSGLGCGTNWPDCPGGMTQARLIEFSHRLVAFVIVVLLAVLAVLALRARREFPRLVSPSVGAFLVVMSQAVLGAIVVKLELHATSVVLHLATAMALVGLLVYVTALAFSADGKLAASADPSTSRQAWVAGASVLALMLVGSYVSGKGAGNVFPDWPLMNDRIVPDLSVEPFALHFLHRALAVLVGVVVFIVSLRIIKRKNDLPLQATLAHAAAGIYAAQVLIGAGNVWTNLNAFLVTAHLIAATLIWVSLVTIAVISRPTVAEASHEKRVVRPQPLVHTGS